MKDAVKDARDIGDDIACLHTLMDGDGSCVFKRATNCNSGKSNSKKRKIKVDYTWGSLFGSRTPHCFKLINQAQLFHRMKNWLERSRHIAISGDKIGLEIHCPKQRLYRLNS